MSINRTLRNNLPLNGDVALRNRSEQRRKRPYYKMLCFLAVLLVIVDLCSVFVPVLAVSDRGVLAEDGNNDDKMVLDLSDPGDSSVVSDAEGEDVFQEGSVSSEGNSYSVTVS